ncbi:hypothetical protein N0V83_004116 [Neocucurbitaria cava]|uniref:C2H2-type domain-containing protein n=1 Tax=Neocucurbitaria cava TaxID=798079 RepID=A0A9W8YBB7_9PLEO|nr:hypothetical protein N0V83_004116 [Neocucurbitaria cava]
MEPPAKRLRILQSVEVDEENPDYINAKQKQQRKFKGRLESIFAKYGSMHESMSDEIDMRENRVVVDRGHLRRLVRQVNRKETILLDNLGMAAGQEPEAGSEKEEEESEYSEDELAPTQRPKSNKRRFEDTTGEQHQRSTEAVAQTSPGENNQLDLRQIAAPASTTLQAGTQEIPGTPNPAANLLQLVHFPQTPAGQQAQNTFYATLARTINHAVQQAVIPLFSNIPANTLNVQLPHMNILPAPTTPAPKDDKIAPATDPKWFFPPLSVESHKEHVAQSSPMPPPTSISVLKDKPSPAKEKGTSVGKQGHQDSRTREESLRLQNEDTPSVARSPAIKQVYSKPLSRQSSPRVEIAQKPSVKRRNYNFTEEDDIYISQKRVLDKHTWSQIRKSKRKWDGWPDMTFSYHWTKHLKKQRLHLKGVPAPSLDLREPSISRGSPAETHHLPTPSSLEHDDHPTEVGEYGSGRSDQFISSSAHFDDDERELLSLAGADTDEEQLPIAEEEAFEVTEADTILPSVELTEFINEDTLQQDLLEGLPSDNALPAGNAAVLAIVKTEPLPSSPSSKRKRETLPMSFQAMPDSEDENGEDVELSDMDIDSAIVASGTFLCDVCQKTFKTANNLDRHQANHCGAHDNIRPNSGSIDLIGDDEVQAPTTPYIKPEVSTPPPAGFLLSTPAFQTPTSLPQRSGIHSSGSKSTSKLDRKTFLKQVKQSWTKKSTPNSKTIAKSRSFQSLPKKRHWAGDAESEDELAM